MNDIPRKRGVPPLPKKKEDGGRDMPFNRPGGVEAVRAQRNSGRTARVDTPPTKKVVSLEETAPTPNQKPDAKEKGQGLNPDKAVTLGDADTPTAEKTVVLDSPPPAQAVDLKKKAAVDKVVHLDTPPPSNTVNLDEPRKNEKYSYDAWGADEVDEVEIDNESDEAESDELFARDKPAPKFITNQRSLRLTERDLRMIDFLARYRFGTREQLAKLTNSSEDAIKVRILKLGHSGFLRKENISNGRGVWTPTNLGMQAVESDFKVLNSGQISMVTMAHTLGLGNLGVEIESGNAVELLGIDADIARVITERQVRSSMDRIKNSREARENTEDFNWIGDEGIIFEDPDYNPTGLTPELVPGNEGLFVIPSPKEHIPDMVVPFERDSDGFPQSIGIELELSAKPHKEWTRILLSYRESTAFGKVVYFTQKKAIASAVMSIAKGIGLTEKQFDMRKYTPHSEHLIWG